MLHQQAENCQILLTIEKNCDKFNMMSIICHIFFQRKKYV